MSIRAHGIFFFFSEDPRFWSLMVFMSAAVFCNQTTQKNVKWTVFRPQAQSNTHPPYCHFPNLNNGDSNDSLASHICCTQS